MRKIYSLILLFSILLISFENISAAPSIRIGAQTSYGQRIEMPAFSMKAQDRFFSMGKSYSSDSHISLSSAGNISSLGVSGNVILKGDDSFIRIILVGQDGKEYLIYQADTIISGGNKLFSLDSVCEETCALPAIKPKEVRLEMNKSTLYLSNIAYDSGLSFESQASAVKASQQEYKIERVKDFINRNNLRWEAGETTISGLSYEEKKKFFLSLDGNMTKVPNLQGLEYYVGGVFEFASDAPSTLNVGASSLPASWNWNNVNGKNWLTSFKDQGRVGTCWSFASLGAMESQIRMYFNQPSLDINLSEQMLVDCTTGQRSAYAMNQIYVSPNPYKGSVPNCFYSDVNYYVISQKGIADEACNRYVERDVASSPSSVVCSRTTCSDWDSRTWKNSSYYGYQFSLNLGDSYCPNKQRGVTAEGLKKLIIEKGPMDVGIVVDGNSGHAMVLVGYETDTDGSTIWIFKNSWGSTGSGTYKPGLVMDRGYLKAKISMDRIIYASLPIGPFIPPTNSSYWPSGFDNTIKCEDNDKDGYCYWGSSTSRPSTCPSTCATEKDCNDSDAKKNVFDSNYQCVAKALKIDGQCGPSHNQTFGSAPVTGLCNSGTASTVSGSGPWTWTCNGSGGGSNASCRAEKSSTACNWTCGAWSACTNGNQTRTCTSSPSGCTGSNPYPTTQPCSSKIDGQCGPSHNQTFGSAPVTGLCNSGTASTVSGSGPWTWTCNGSGGGSNASCRAEKGSTTITLSCSASSSSSITCDVSGAPGAIYYNLHYFDDTVNQHKNIDNIGAMPHTVTGLKCGPGNKGGISNYNSFQVQVCGPAGMFEFSKGNYSCTNYIGRANGTIGTYVDLPCVSNSACGVANNTSTVITPTSGLCADGSSPHVLASGNQWTWKCGSTSCSATDPNAPYKGMFSATEMPTFTGQGDNPDTAEVWLQWHCSSGFPKAQTIFQNYEQVSCTYGSIGSHGGCTGCAMSKFTIKKKGLAPISGQCGSSHGQSMDSVPVTGLCNSGTPSAVSGSGPWTWVCEGVSGGSNASCRAEKSSTFCNWTCSDWSACINGKQTRTCTSSGCLTGKPETEKACSPTGKVSCGPDHGQVLNAKPSNNLCNNGNVLASVGDGPWYWICQDYMKDETILCYARKGASQIDGACGNSHGISLPSAPSTGLCSQGTSSPVYGTGPWVWICSGVNGGKPAICFATKTTSIVVNKACGSSDGKSSVTAPTTGLCSSGNNSTIVRNDTDGNWTWQCGNETCKATDPNREYKKVFGAIEMSSYSGNPTSPDKTTIAIQDYHCNWLPSGTAYKGYKKVSCKYEPIGTHGACEKCSVVLMQIEKK